MEDANTYKSTYQILKEMSEVWGDLTDKTKAQALEMMFGKLRANIGAAVLKNFSAAEKAMDDMANSAGSADAEMSVAMDSIEYKLNALKETGTGIAQNLFAREDMKALLDVLVNFGNVLDSITNKFGLFNTAITGIAGFGIASFVKNFAKPDKKGYHLKLSYSFKLGNHSQGNNIMALWTRLWIHGVFNKTLQTRYSGV